MVQHIKKTGEDNFVVTLTKTKLMISVAIMLISFIGSPLLANFIGNVFWKDNLEKRIIEVDEKTKSNTAEIEKLKEADRNYDVLSVEVQNLIRELREIKPQLSEFNKQIIDIYKQKR